ncbi:unnamed protein product, partial [marine sediment metagenome]
FDPQVVAALQECWHRNRQAWQQKVNQLVQWVEADSAAVPR